MKPTLPQQIIAVLECRTEIVAGYLFGSRASGESTQASDVDLALLARRPLPLDALVGLQDEFEAALGLKVDLIDLTQADAFLALDAVRGERIFERDGRHVDEFELYVLRRAADLAPFEQERRRLLLAAATS